MNVTSYLPTIARYVIVAAMSAVAARGWLSPESNAILTQNLDIIVSAIVGFITVGYALFKRPSDKAMDAAKAIDKELPVGSPVVIKTPGAQPDIVVQPRE